MMKMIETAEKEGKNALGHMNANDTFVLEYVGSGWQYYEMRKNIEVAKVDTDHEYSYSRLL